MINCKVIHSSIQNGNGARAPAPQQLSYGQQGGYAYPSSSLQQPPNNQQQQQQVYAYPLPQSKFFLFRFIDIYSLLIISVADPVNFALDSVFQILNPDPDLAWIRLLLKKKKKMSFLSLKIDTRFFLGRYEGSFFTHWVIVISLYLLCYITNHCSVYPQPHMRFPANMMMQQNAQSMPGMGQHMVQQQAAGMQNHHPGMPTSQPQPGMPTSVPQVQLGWLTTLNTLFAILFIVEPYTFLRWRKI